MHTDETSDRHRIHPGCELIIMLPAGGEIYCLHGTARMVPAAQMPIDSLTTTSLILSVGQGWRSAQLQTVTIANDGHEPCMIRRVLPAASFQAAPKENRLAAYAAKRLQEALLWIRRGPTAASVKSP